MLTEFCTLLTVCVVLIAVAPAFAEEPVSKLRISSPITHSDWVLATEPAPAWGPEGVKQILDRAKECGWTRVYWRCLDAGKSMYNSRLLDPFDSGDEVNYWRHSIGLEVHAWLSINEDDHAYGWPSRFTLAHPEFRWVRRDGTRYNSQLSFGFAEVRAYKIALLKEILAYKPDGVFFDWIRTGDVRDNPQTDAEGIANHGYETPNVDAFKAQYGVDPHDVPNNDERWVSVRCEGQTAFMRDAHALIKQQDPNLAISVMVHHPWAYRGAKDDTPYADSRRGLLCDVRTWAREGLIDEAVVAGYYREGGSAEKGFEWLKKETEGKVDLWLYGWLSTSASIAADIERAKKRGSQTTSACPPRKPML